MSDIVRLFCAIMNIHLTIINEKSKQKLKPYLPRSSRRKTKALEPVNKFLFWIREMKKEKILVVDDNPDILMSASYLLERHYETVVTCDKPEDIPGLMNKESFDVILLDMNFHPGQSDGKMGMQLLEKIRAIDPEAVVLMITAHGSLNAAVEAMKLGASDYVVKPWDNQRLLATISTALKLKQSWNEATRLRQSNRVLSGVTGQNKQTIIGSSPTMKNLLSLVSRAAPTDANVLILGENGTGKELIAREIHRQSKRSDQVFIPVDLGAISETLFESERIFHGCKGKPHRLHRGGKRRKPVP